MANAGKTKSLHQLSSVFAFCYLRYGNKIIIGDFSVSVEPHH